MRGSKLNLIGQQFGKLSVIERGESKGYRTYWVCKCDCGNISSVRGSHLVRGAVKSCGKCLLDIIGETYGHFTVVSYAEKRHNKDNYWYIRCSCGEVKKIRQDLLLKGDLPRCGCREKVRAPKRYSAHPLLRIWLGMKSRCYDAGNKRYRNYGGRGITVCDRWLDSFDSFVEDMGERPSGYTLDRINNDGNYEPSNCRWVTKLVNNRNKSNNIYMVFMGIRFCLAELAALMGLSGKACSKRLKNGWPLTGAMLFPVKTDLTLVNIGRFMRNKKRINAYGF